jgi:hypothetical protein
MKIMFTLRDDAVANEGEAHREALGILQRSLEELGFWEEPLRWTQVDVLHGEEGDDPG